MLRIPIRGYELAEAVTCAGTSKLRIPIRGYERLRGFAAGIGLHVTNPYKGL